MAKPIPLEDIYLPAPVQEPSREQTRQIVEGLQRCHHPDSKHEFLRTWIRDWTAHKTTPPAAQRQWVNATTWRGLTDKQATKAALWDLAVSKGLVTVHTEQLAPGTWSAHLSVASWIEGHDKACDISNEAAHGIKEKRNDL